MTNDDSSPHPYPTPSFLTPTALRSHHDYQTKLAHTEEYTLSSDDESALPATLPIPLSYTLVREAHDDTLRVRSTRVARNRRLFHYDCDARCYGYEHEDKYDDFVNEVEWRLLGGKDENEWEVVPMGWSGCWVERPVRYLFDYHEEDKNDGTVTWWSGGHGQLWWDGWKENQGWDEESGDESDYRSADAESADEEEDSADEEWKSAQEKTETHLSKRDVTDRPEGEDMEQGSQSKRLKWSGKNLAEGVYDEADIL
ncbi:hypothetical protein BJ508DRAFT_327331 [Ascobolus immersus RN42]|uniref:Uncharacterized protein n=1 Tax=Ascobolus immersus RN42 TaxID=1160509 RepID=A0A3N4I4V0_ASCIM|nr:hypothetical protein BJ508DRAFT_327331 [Ascobolus immersus RN42]